MPLPKLLALIMIVSVMFGAGLQLDRRRFVETLQQYGLLARAFLANFVLVPLCALLIVTFFRINPEVAAGIVLMSLAPGVPFLPNLAGRAGGGSLSLALTISFLFAALSVITIPLTMLLVVAVFPHAPVPRVPTSQFLITLVAFQLVPLVIGALIGARLKDQEAERLAKICHLVFIAGALALVVAVFPKVITAIASVYGFGHLLIIAGIGIFSLIVGWLLGGPIPRYRRTLSVATLMRNIGLCALIGASPQFAGTLVLPTILAYFIITFLLSLPVRALYKRTKDLAGSAAA
jgi:BASS family bile acid:Na+ symporter